MRKWQFITHTLQTFFPEEFYAIELAERIDDTMLRLYGDVDTEEWKTRVADYMDYRDLGRYGALVLIMDVAGSVDNCYACFRHGKDCKICEFAKVEGICSNADSTYTRFRYIMRVLSKIENGAYVPFFEWILSGMSLLGCKENVKHADSLVYKLMKDFTGDTLNWIEDFPMRTRERITMDNIQKIFNTREYNPMCPKGIECKNCKNNNICSELKEYIQ